MKRFLATLCAIALTMPLVAQQVIPTRPRSCKGKKGLRLMCYNVRNCKGADEEVSYDRVAETMQRCAPDVIAIQELDSMTRRYPGQYVLGNLANKMEMNATFCHSIEYKGGRYGIGLLSREKPLSVERVPLPCPREPRVLLIAEFERYYVLVSHWSLNADYRTRTAEILNEQLKRLKAKPVFLCGDFNANPKEAAMKRLAEGYDVLRKEGNRFTFPAWEPRYEIDYLCVGRNAAFESVGVQNHIVIDSPEASDHAPFIADISLK